MILAQGYVAQTIGSLYTAKGDVQVTAVVFYNTSGVTQAVQGYLRKGNDAPAEAFRLVLGLNWTADPVPDKGWPLAAGDSIDASTTTAQVQKFTVLGVPK